MTPEEFYAEMAAGPARCAGPFRIQTQRPGASKIDFMASTSSELVTFLVNYSLGGPVKVKVSCPCTPKPLVLLLVPLVPA